MCAQAALVEERLQARQEDFHGSYFSPNGDGVRLLSGVEQLSGEAAGVSRTSPAVPTVKDLVEGQQPDPVVAEGTLVVSTHDREYKFPMVVRGEMLPDGSATMSYFDHAGTLSLQHSGDPDTLNIRVLYTDKPLHVALESATFLELLATTRGVLSLEMSRPVEGGEVVTERMEIEDLPLPVPESWLEDHRNRVRLLQGLYDIWINTGIEVRYPADTGDEEGLQNYNFVQRAVRGGWVALSVDSFDGRVPNARARAFLKELRTEGQVGRTFYLEVPKESYTVFGEEVDLGPSSRYVAAARLRSTQQDILGQLSDRGEGEGTVNLTWEPIENMPMHVFFDQWPKSSVAYVRRELQEYEILYGVDSERFRRAWEHNEPWTQDVQDGSRWFSLIEAEEERAAGT